MESTDFELIRRTLSGDQDAFTALVQKYQKRVHALAWRKTGDFHVAEEITQDTFLRAYKNLGTLKNPNLFAGWLYVIANRLCNTWFEKRSPHMQSLETVPTVELEEHLYSEYTAKQREERASEKRVDLVKRLLQKLPESERIVITLHYLAGSSVKEISQFLGVSLNTVKSRLYRARQRLQKEDHMVRETLGSFQPSTNLMEKMMESIGIGVIGCDEMGRRLATNAHAVEGLEVICVSDSREELAEKLAVDINVDYTLDYHELLADERIRVVLITTSPTMRLIANEAGKTGKYLFFGMDQDIPAYEIQHMLIEHLLPTEAWDEALEIANTFL